MAGREGLPIGLRAGTVADASEAHALNSTFSDTEVEAALNALGAVVNELLDELRSTGIIDS